MARQGAIIVRFGQPEFLATIVAVSDLLCALGSFCGLQDLSESHFSKDAQ
jgi:hypothetical protein